MSSTSQHLDQLQPSLVTGRAGLASNQLDPLSSPVLREKQPGLASALDEQVMRDHLQALLFGETTPRYVIERCNPGQALYLPGEFCGVRYEMEVNDGATGQQLRPLVIGRVFQSRVACAGYVRERLRPVADRVRGRAEMDPFIRPVAALDPLHMAVHVFPIDAELPELVVATDRGRLPQILGGMLPDVREGHFSVRDCQFEVAHYGRRHRCTLRYTLTGTLPGQDSAHRRVVYGKVTADGSGATTGQVIAALHEQVIENSSAFRFNIPHALGFRPDLRLLLLEAIPGKPEIAQLLKARLRGDTPAAHDGLTLGTAMDICARILAALHTSRISLGRRRTLDDELAWIGRSTEALGRISPELGAQLQAWLAAITAYARASDPLPLCFSHGDFTYTQLIFDGLEGGLVDFDTICQAEPALDLGQFLAYQRLAVRKDQDPAAPLPPEVTEQLCASFMNTYIEAAGDRPGYEQRLRVRVSIYELLSLLRLAVHSWQKLKISRLEHAMTLVEERMRCLP